jgi:hypothetical protein
MTTNQWRVLTALVLGFSLGLISSMSNGLSFVPAAGRGAAFALLVGLLVWLLSWASETAVHKGYSPWLGFWLVILLNLVGILVLLWLPSRANTSSHRSTG